MKTPRQRNRNQAKHQNFLLTIQTGKISRIRPLIHLQHRKRTVEQILMPTIVIKQMLAKSCRQKAIMLTKLMSQRIKVNSWMNLQVNKRMAMKDFRMVQSVLVCRQVDRMVQVCEKKANLASLRKRNSQVPGLSQAQTRDRTTSSRINVPPVEEASAKASSRSRKATKTKKRMMLANNRKSHQESNKLRQKALNSQPSESASYRCWTCKMNPNSILTFPTWTTMTMKDPRLVSPGEVGSQGNSQGAVERMESLATSPKVISRLQKTNQC